MDASENIEIVNSEHEKVDTLPSVDAGQIDRSSEKSVSSYSIKHILWLALGS
jgi:hypothetical protein